MRMRKLVNNVYRHPIWTKVKLVKLFDAFPKTSDADLFILIIKCVLLHFHHGNLKGKAHVFESLHLITSIIELR